MNNNIIEAFESKLLDIIKNDGINSDGRITIAAKDLLSSIKLYKVQLNTIDYLQKRVEILEKEVTNSESVIVWQKRAELAEHEKDLTVYDFNELYKSYSQIIHESVSIKRKYNSLAAENAVLKEALWSIAVTETDDVDSIKEYAGASLESITALKTE